MISRNPRQHWLRFLVDTRRKNSVIMTLLLRRVSVRLCHGAVRQTSHTLAYVDQDTASIGCNGVTASETLFYKVTHDINDIGYHHDSAALN